MKVAVVGHVEWCQFVRVDRFPGRGEIAHGSEWWEEPAGGGAVAAVQLARLAGECLFLTAVGDDALGRRARATLEREGVQVHAAVREESTRRAVVFVDGDGERTITVLGDKLVPRRSDRTLPWGDLEGADAVFFVSGDAEAVRAARRARVLTATPRELDVLREARVVLDALVGSGEDAGERFRPGDLDPAPRLAVATAGHLGGWTQPGGPYRAVDPPSRRVDAYGAGDSFAAGLTYALAAGEDREEALALAARCGALALTRRGAHGTGPRPGPPPRR
jgi:ribokinase